MSERARDVVRYIKAIEDTGGYRSIWRQSDREPFGFFGFVAQTPDGWRARCCDIFDPVANARAALRVYNAGWDR